MYDRLVEKWKRDGESGEELENHVLWFCKASDEDKCADISGTYGIFDATMKGDIYTYFFYDCDTLNYKYYGTKNWYKGAKIYRIDYNVKTDEFIRTECKRFNRRCTENRCRIL